MKAALVAELLSMVPSGAVRHGNVCSLNRASTPS